MDKIEFSFLSVDNLLKKLADQAKKAQDEIDKLSNDVATVASWWTGESGAGFMAHCNESIREIKVFIEGIKDVNTYVDFVAKSKCEYENTGKAYFS